MTFTDCIVHLELKSDKMILTFLDRTSTWLRRHILILILNTWIMMRTISSIALKCIKWPLYSNDYGWSKKLIVKSSPYWHTMDSRVIRFTFVSCINIINDFVERAFVHGNVSVITLWEVITRNIFSNAYDKRKENEYSVIMILVCMSSQTVYWFFFYLLRNIWLYISKNWIKYGNLCKCWCR